MIVALSASEANGLPLQNDRAHTHRSGDVHIQLRLYENSATAQFLGLPDPSSDGGR